MRIVFLFTIVLLAAIFTFSCSREGDESGYICDGTYDPAVQKYDEDGSLLNLCGNMWHKPSLSEYCSEGKVKEKEIYTDPRDGKEYKIVAIGTQTWLAENLSYATHGSKCGGTGGYLEDANTENCDKFGRLYDWTTALTICPDGWHLPSNEEWTALTDYAGGEDAGKKLKATNYWKPGIQYQNVKLKSTSDYVMSDYIPCSIDGTDDYGFSALPGGSGYNYSTNQNRFEFFNESGYWWSVTEFTSSSAYYRAIHHYSNSVASFRKGKTDFLSVRCIKD